MSLEWVIHEETKLHLWPFSLSHRCFRKLLSSAKKRSQFSAQSSVDPGSRDHFQSRRRDTTMLGHIRGCMHDTGATFTPEWVHSGFLSWLYICLHDTNTKCHAGASHPGVSSLRCLYRSENFTAVRNLATVSCKRETTIARSEVAREIGSS